MKATTNQSKCYCPNCQTVVEPVKKFSVVVWEQVQRCQTVEVLADSPEVARQKVKAAYEQDRNTNFPEGDWAEEMMTPGKLWTGRQGPAPHDLKGEHKLTGIVAEEVDA